MLRARSWWSVWAAVICALGGTGCGKAPHSHAPQPLDLRINEVVSNNEGVWVDEAGEADDYIELYNASKQSLVLSDYVLVHHGNEHALPQVELAPGAVQLLWADNTPQQGPLHLDLRFTADGEKLVLKKTTGVEVDRIHVPPLDAHQAYVRLPDGVGTFSACGWASPTRLNGKSCGPAAPPPAPADVVFTPVDLGSDWPARTAPLAIVEAALNPASFVEVVNSAADQVAAADYTLRLAPHAAGQAWPGPNDGVSLPLPEDGIAPGARAVIDVTSDDTASIASDPDFQGVLTLFRSGDGTVVDRVDFSTWPADAVLALPEPSGTWHLCTVATPGQPNDRCSPLKERPTTDRERQFLTDGDFHALAAGRGGNGAESVEFIVDLQSGGTVTFINAGVWDLHYTFIREIIDGDAHLDRCDPAQRDEYNKGWAAFSQDNYFITQGRRYLLGTLVRYAGTNLETIEFAPGDNITSDQMKQAFFAVLERVPDPEHWVIRPQGDDQIERVLEIQGQVPIVGPNAPFSGVSFQSLTAGKAFGTLRFVPAADLKSTPLGPQDIVVTDDVPNDTPLIGGLVTEAFQTPLAHVNILSRGRGTPNMALRDARHDPKLLPYFGKLVKLEVDASNFSVILANQQEALDFWDSRKPSDVRRPRLDTSVRGVQALADHSYADLPFLGGKAAAMSELERVAWCDNKPAIPPDQPFAIPVVHSLEHYAASGALDLLDKLRQDPAFRADPMVREKGLASVRQRILEYPVDPAILTDVQNAIAARWTNLPLRFRSSSNTEDLAGFSGAGLYISEGVDVNELPQGIENAMRQVWASLWDRRGYDEREYSAVDQHAVAMAVLVHPAYKSERVNGVAISRDALQPTRADRYYVNAQLGEALVTNPAPGIESDELTVELYRTPRVVYHGHSTFSPSDAPVISEAEASVLVCNLFQIHQHFRPLLDPNQQNPWFAMDIEWKLMGDDRQLIIKQARPYSFGDETPSGWCDF